MKVLIIEDGTEYSDTFGRFLSEGFEWVRAGNGEAAILLLKSGSFDCVFCDMRFDRIEAADLVGDVVAVSDQFNGDVVKTRQHLQDHQGNYILAAIRDAGIRTPVLMSYDFDAEPRRWHRIEQRYAPVAYLADQSGPTEVAQKIRRLVAHKPG